VHLNDVVRDTVLLAGSQVARAGIGLAVTAAEALPPVLGDASALEQVVLNLLTNAAAAVDGGGQIGIATRRHPERGACVQLIVTDSGAGIPADALPRIFDPFFSTKPGGTGLGLSVSDGIVREHGGTIEVESAPGRGTRFTITLPALDRPA
jgi:signal transduction histidine kinase